MEAESSLIFHLKFSFFDTFKWGEKKEKRKIKEMLTIKIKYSVIFNSHVTFTTLNFLIFQKIGLTFDPLYQTSVTDEKNQKRRTWHGFSATMAAPDLILQGVMKKTLLLLVFEI